MDREDNKLLINNAVEPIWLGLCEKYKEKTLFIRESENSIKKTLTGFELYKKITNLSTLMESNLKVQDKAVILLPQGLEYIVALLSCYTSNIIAIPTTITSLSDKNKISEKIIPVIDDSKAKCIITNSAFESEINKGTNENISIINIDKLSKNNSVQYKGVVHSKDDIAMLLYTSGSSSQPKGVMLTHDSIVQQAINGIAQWNIKNDSHIVSWMPQFHNFGLVLNILSPISKGATTTILSPDSFIKNPESWFKYIDKYKATHTGAPNFAFDYCCSLIDIDSVKKYSLKSLKAVICGGEPISQKTFEDFYKKYKELGFVRNAFCPHYGMSEVGSITTKKPGKPIRFLSLDIQSLEKRIVKHTKEKNKNKSITSCGEISQDISISIVNTEKNTLIKKDEIGEIWVKSQAAAIGYFNREKETKEAFYSTLNDTKESGYIRTGDLGFIENNNLYIVGREKEVIIIHGKNHYPVDIEWTIKKSIRELTLPLCVISYDGDKEEKVVVVQEYDEKTNHIDRRAIAHKIISIVSQTHGLELYDVVLVKKGSIPKTGSGKIKRKSCATAYKNNEISKIYEHIHGLKNTKQENNVEAENTKNNILILLKRKVFSEVMQEQAKFISDDMQFSELGLNSVKYIRISKLIEDIFSIKFAPVLLFKYQSIIALASYITSQVDDKSKEMESKIDNQPDSNIENINRKDIAIIGMCCNLPGDATDLESFWKNIEEYKDCITAISQSRKQILEDYELNYGSLKDSFPQWGGFIKDVDKFDAPFFGISPLEAESMDPQQRKALELVWNVIEDSGYNPHHISGKDIGLFIGAHNNDYCELISRQPELIHTYGAFLDSGLHMSLVSHRASRWFDFHGPSEVINTACSSSLVSIHHAIEAIHRGECKSAIAGGINLILSSRIYRAGYKAGMLSPDGRCKTFDEKGNGFVRAEGYGAVLLKPLKQALMDNDTIYGVIKGATINHDGKSNSLRAPNLNAQRELLKQAYKNVDLPLETISYIETHGTGTSLGDPIEIQALQEAFKELQPNSKSSFCALGTVKTNIGHGESTAGIAGFIKLILSMNKKIIPGILHFNKINPYISLEDSPFYIADKNQRWNRLLDEDKNEIPNRAGISSFGFGGANAHIIVEEYIDKDKKQEDKLNIEKAIVPISARNKDCLKANTKKLSEYLKNNKKTNLASIAYTLQIGRAEMDERVIFIVKSTKDLIDKLDKYNNGIENIDNCWTGNIRASMDKNKPTDVHNSSYEEIVSNWILGKKIQWEQLYSYNKPKRIHLPAYQFAKLKYWIPKQKKKEYSDCLKTQQNLSVNELKYKKKDKVISKKESYVTKQWMISEKEALNKIEKAVAIIYSEETAKLANKLSKQFDKSQLIHIDKIQAIISQNQIEWSNYNGCIDIIGCGSEINDSNEWLLFLQGLIENSSKENIKVLCVTKALESFENNVVNMVGASRVGLYRMLQYEYSHVQSQHLDLEDSLEEIELAEYIAEEYKSNSVDIEVCYRNKQRYKAYLNEFSINDNVNTNISFNDNEVLLITGGTRGLGYLCAEHFVKKYGVKKLVLTGREELPPREQWNKHIDDNNSIAKKINQIQKLEEFGVEIKVLALPLSNEELVKDDVNEIRKTMGSIVGVIHCAGFDNSDNPAFIKKSIKEISATLEPKVEGLNVLYDSVKKDSLQFFILYSSVSAIIPSLSTGHSDYAMANSYMDYFAEAKSGKCPITSIQWPNWKEAGMGEIKNKPYDETGLLSHTDDEGLMLLEKIIKNNLNPVILPAIVNKEIWQPENLLVSKCVELDSKFNSDYKKQYNRQKGRGMDLEELQQWLKELFAKELRMDTSTLEVDMELQDLGVDSILLTQLTKTISKNINKELDPSIMLEYPSIALLSQFLIKEYKAEIEKLMEITHSQEIDSYIKNILEVESIEENEAKVIENETSDKTIKKSCDIAVVGLTCRFPGAETLEDYWDVLSKGKCTVTKVPTQRWGYANDYYAGLLNNIYQFDNKFFLIPEEDAKAMDPQALVLMEEALKLIYNTGYTHKELKGKSIGVYVGARSQYQPKEEELNNSRNPVVVMGQNYLSANISQFFDFRGPSLVIDTACSSSLVGMNMAIQDLKTGETEGALVGGISLLSNDKTHRIFEQRGILSEEKDFHIFDKRANGVVLGEGIGMVYLKTVEKALKDGDKIFAVIKGLAVNNDGRTAGPATPNLQAQKQVLEKALTKSKKKPTEISYIEVNGSGTEVTDLLELKAIQAVYGTENPLSWGLGSMKPNIGHPLCAEGIASFIKVVLMLHNNKFVPFLSGMEAMSHFDIEASPFYFNRELKDWGEKPKAVAINCFADGGTNAHVILEAWDSGKKELNIRPALEVPKLNHSDFSNHKKEISSSKNKSNWWTKNF